MALITKFTTRLADADDIPLLLKHHRRMFEEILTSPGSDMKTLNAEKLDNAYGAKLANELGNVCNAWIVEKGKTAIASGAITLCSMVPVPNDYSYKVAYLHSIFTENNFRKQGLATHIMGQAVAFCRENKIKRLILNASEDGKPLYKKLGFEFVNNSMRMFIN